MERQIEVDSKEEIKNMIVEYRQETPIEHHQRHLQNLSPQSQDYVDYYMSPTHHSHYGGMSPISPNAPNMPPTQYQYPAQNQQMLKSRLSPNMVSTSMKNGNRTNSSNLAHDQALIAEIRRFPCLYDRAHPDYKKVTACQHAWSQICEECNWVKNSDEAIRLFEVLKKRYSKKKMDYKRARLSTDEPLLIKKAETELEKYHFMKWMEPFIRFRTTKLVNEKSNADRTTYREEQHQMNSGTNKTIAEYAYEQTIGGGSGANRKRSYDYGAMPVHNFYDEQSRIAYKNSTVVELNGRMSYSPNSQQQQQRLEPKRSRIQPSPIRMQASPESSFTNKETTGLEGSPHHHPVRSSSKETTFSDQHSPTPTETSHKSGQEEQPNPSIVTTSKIPYATKFLSNEDDLFSALIVSEMKNLDERRRYQVKHKISNILFDALMEQCNEKKQDTDASSTDNN
ncbi:uncharacterized protein [Clytia hemisphaerica]|uniref:MADF domain-containing protein n=1 Tax=Clytia hemisphaerica TaxID=252671 RepID=A0A7M5XE84_9CNID|eukprot:TCONS_00066957-protein